MKWLLALCEGISASATIMGRPLLEFKTLNYLAGVHKSDKKRFNNGLKSFIKKQFQSFYTIAVTQNILY